MDRRSFCKVLGFAAGSTLLPGLMVQAAGQGSVGHAVPDGRYAIVGILHVLIDVPLARLSKL